MNKYLCPHCRKPFTTKNARNGHIAHCPQRLYGVDRIVIKEDGKQLKYCPVCKQHKPLTAFRKDAKAIGGVGYRCKECMLKIERRKAKQETASGLDMVPRQTNPQFGIQVPELLENETGHITRSSFIDWNEYEAIIKEFEELGYTLEKIKKPDHTVYDTVSDIAGVIVLLSDESMRFWITKAKGQLSNRDALKRLLLEVV